MSAAVSAAGAPAGARGLATVQDAPQRKYGGLRDQDRIFQNAYMRHDHLLKGALVSFSSIKDVMQKKFEDWGN